MVTKSPAALARQGKDNCPWQRVEPDGSNLTVDKFPSTLIVQLANMLRREVTTQYAERFGLTVSEWRLLALIVRFSPLPFGELVRLSSSDKALVSRTLRILEQRGFCSVQPEPGGNRKKLVCVASEAGTDLYEQIMPVAQKYQANVLAQLDEPERVALYTALMKLRKAADAGLLRVPTAHDATDR
ncbi:MULTISPECIES: MarR family winged helix-turn-helix transcriptional regulator [unclassified Pusillimonas]|uniref:MarR family winged helix-turn-helix transcriptional regulator n=1 Tax=unclassified Pusillimonas TaxID=2640016 RepID=UPI000B9CA449|nr:MULTISPECIES: MarR family transcriptional regulator [unclassified Pusillimonas]OXR50525.1 MarR family transcriptional regulator [Pusillimonas sp. T2]ROT45554.1 hypothetical protein CHR62_07355 [Pusillimonas sp. NJUB218]